MGAIAKVLHGLFGIIESFNDWLIQLVANCQKQGIIRTQTPPQNIVPLLIALAKAHLFDWVCCDGQFPLQSTLRKSYETFLDAAPEYRAWMWRVRSSILFEKPHSLSYHAMSLTK